MVVHTRSRGQQQSVKTMEGHHHHHHHHQKVEANILLYGADHVGKSALTVRFLTRRFIGEYGDIESINSHVDKIDGREVSFNIWDCLYSQDRVISDKQLQWADGIVLVYSICDQDSFDVVRRQVQHLRCSGKTSSTSSSSSSTPIIIVGNKRDLQRHRTVSSEEGHMLALSQDCGFFEISAAETYHGVLLVFHGLADLIKGSHALKRGAASVRSIVRTVTAVFGKKRAKVKE